MPTPLTSVSAPLDLLKQIDVARDARSGAWTTNGGMLVSPATSAAALEIPYQPPPAYRWTVVAQRLSGSESLALGFVIEQRNSMCVLEGWGQKISGLNLLDNQTGDNNATTVRQPVFNEGQSNTIVLTVRPKRVQCEVNGRMIIDWTGEPRQLSLDRRYWSKVGNGSLFLGTWDAGYAISKCQVEVLPLSEALAPTNQSAGAPRPLVAEKKWPVPTGWHKLEDAANRFRAAFPIQPFNQPQLTGVQYLAEHDDMAFSAQMAPAEVGRAREDVVLSRICQETFNTGEHRLLTVGTPTHIGKMWALSAVARDDEGQIYTIRMHLKEGRIYTAFVLTNSGEERKPAVKQFLDAFQVMQ